MGTTVIEQMGGRYRRLKIACDGRMAFAVNEGATQNDFLLQRPTVHPFNTPSGLTVTEHAPHNFLHHKGLWIGHGRVNGVNCFHDGPTRGRIAVRERAVDLVGEAARLEYVLDWVDAEGRPVMAERRVYRFLPSVAGGGRGTAHRLDVTSTLTAAYGPVTLAQDTHAYCGARVADMLDGDDGGAVVNSAGDRGEAGAMGKPADWVDSSGRMGAGSAGLTLMVHPSSRPTPLFVRDYGTVLANPFLHAGREVPAGERFTLACSFLAHDGDAEGFDVSEAFARFAGDPVA